MSETDAAYMMFEMNSRHRQISSENPVGPEEAPIKLDLPMWQVYIALFLIASALTIYKLYESNYIAPKQVVNWQPFDSGEFSIERQRRNLLIWVPSDNTETDQNIAELFTTPPIQAAVYLGRLLAIQTPADNLDQETAAWLHENMESIQQGGLALWPVSAAKPQYLASADIDSQSLLAWLEQRD